MVNKLKGRAAINRDLNKLKKWDDKNPTKFHNKDKHKAFYLG